MTENPTENPAAPRELSDSDPNAGEQSGLAGDMGISSERVGAVRGSPEPTTHGTESLESEDPGADAPPEQAADSTNPDDQGIDPR